MSGLRELEEAVIDVAADLEAGVDRAGVRSGLDALAAELRSHVRNREGLSRARALVRAFHRQLGFHAPDDYGDERLHFIHHVLARRVGSPVALSVVLIALGRRLDVELEPVAFPGTFLVRAPGPTPVLIEPCTGAMPIPVEPLTRLASEELGLDEGTIEALLRPAGARAVAVRTLENLEEVYRQRGDRARALLVADRILALGGPAAMARRMVGSLVRTLRGEEPASDARRLEVDRRGLWFRVDGGPAVDLRRRRALPLLLVRFAEHHRARPTHGLGWPALVEAGWPGEKMLPDAAWARLRTAIRTLRKLGLSDALITVGTGYMIDPSWDVILD